MPDTFKHGYALLIGVGETSYTQWSLPVTVKDVRALRAALTDAHLCAYPNDADHVRLLHDAGATRAAILDGLNWLAERAIADPEATIVVYYSGHGGLDEAGERYYLLPHDVEPFDLPGSALAAQDFSAALREITARRLLVFVDSCHAQGMATAKDKPGFKLPPGYAQMALPKGVSDALKAGEGRAVFAASRGTQRSWVRPDDTLSIYTHHLLEALRGAGNRPGEQVVRVSNLMSHLGQAVPASARRLCQAEQTPFFDTATEDFAVALLRGGKGLPTRSVTSTDRREPIATISNGRGEAPTDSTSQAKLHGDGAIAKGPRAVSTGAGDVAVGGNVGSDVVETKKESYVVKEGSADGRAEPVLKIEQGKKGKETGFSQEFREEMEKGSRSLIVMDSKGRVGNIQDKEVNRAKRVKKFVSAMRKQASKWKWVVNTILRDGAVIVDAGVKASKWERVVNTGFAPKADAAAPLEPTTPLTYDQPYYFWLEVGPLIEGSIEETPTPLPTEHLPPEAQLQVVLFPFQDEIEITPDADVGELQLQPDGSVLVTCQATQPRSISPESDLLKRRLFFPVRTPDREGTFHLRCNIYYEQVLVQSRLIHARVMREPQPVEQALRSVLDYNLTRTLDPVYINRLSPHRLSIMLNQSSDGTHDFRFFGAQDGQNFKHDVSLDPPLLQDLIHKARGALSKAAWGDEGTWKNQNYRYDSDLDLEKLKSDLINLAIKGYRFYATVTPKVVGGAQPQVKELTDLMIRPGAVQIALRESARLVLPVALFYDYPLNTNAQNITLCPSFLSALKENRPLEEHECFQGQCPSRGDKTVVCPSGFWGYRHSIGMPLSISSGSSASLEIHCKEAPEMAVCVSTDPAFKLRPIHEQTLKSIRLGLGWHYADTRDNTFKLLKQGSHLVYFYCHGGVAEGVPYIQVGSTSETGITPDNLLLEEIYWDEPRPFVFINGCHTTALEPEVALEFVSAFVNTANASGVMGTEITVFEPLAKDFAEECMRRFLAGTTIGEAVRGARLALLQKGNPLGLVYIPFVISSLRLVEQKA